MLTTAPPQPTLLLPNLEIPTVDDIQVVGATGGVNIALREAHPDGLLVRVLPYPTMNLFDAIDVFWGDEDSPAVTGSVQTLNEPVYLRIPIHRIEAGYIIGFYRVRRVDGGLPENSARLTYRVKLDRPGGNDPDAGEPGHQGLTEPSLPQDVIDFGVGPEYLEDGVPVTIAPYENMRLYDTLELHWGSETLTHRLDEEAELNNEVVILVPGDTLLEAGNDDGINVVYKVYDEVFNNSRDSEEFPWSPTVEVEVDIGDAPLAEAYVVQAGADQRQIDLEELGHEDVTVEASVERGQADGSESITLTWRGLTRDGAVVLHNETKPLERSPRTLEFRIPNGLVQEIAMGRVVVFFHLVKTDGTVVASKRNSLYVIGEAQGLIPPELLDAPEGVLPPELEYARVEIPNYPGKAVGDNLVLYWSGTSVEGERIYHTIERPVTEGDLLVPIVRLIEKDYIAVLSGSHVEVWYGVNPGTAQERWSQVVFVPVGETLGALPEPEVAQARDGYLDPDDLPPTVTLSIPRGLISDQDKVIYFWEGTVSGLATDSLPANGTQDPIEFELNTAALVNPNRDHSVDVYYEVWRGTRLLGSSVKVTLSVGKAPLILKAPVLPEAPGDVLDPLPERQAVTLRVAYTGMLATDQIGIRWHDDDTFPSQPGRPEGYVDFVIAARTLALSLGLTVPINYAVVRDGVVLPSETLHLHVLPLANDQLPTPAIPQASDGTPPLLDVTALTENASFVVPPWPYMAMGQMFWFRAYGRQSNDSELILSLLGGRVGQNDLQNGVIRPLYLTQLRQLKNGSALRLEMKVEFSALAQPSEDDAITLPEASVGILTNDELGENFDRWPVQELAYPQTLALGSLTLRTLNSGTLLAIAPAPYTSELFSGHSLSVRKGFVRIELPRLYRRVRLAAFAVRTPPEASEVVIIRNAGGALLGRAEITSSPAWIDLSATGPLIKYIDLECPSSTNVLWLDNLELLMTLAPPGGPGGRRQSLPLFPASIPVADSYPVVSADGGINIELRESSSLGVGVLIPTYLGMAVGDWLHLYWADPATPIASHQVTSDTEQIRLYIPTEQVLPGMTALFYQVEDASGVLRTAPTRLYWVKLTRPGGNDPQAGIPGHQGLVAPIVPPEIIDGGVGEEEARNGVLVTIKPYPYMTVRDRIELRWGSEAVIHRLEDTAEVGQDVIIYVDEDTILLAGDDERLNLRYRVIDEVNNYSLDSNRLHWSPSTWIDVYAGNSKLSKPHVVEAVGGIIDLQVLGGQDATVEITTDVNDYVAGETLELAWRGVSQTGQLIDHYAERLLDSVPGVEPFSVPGDRVEAIADGRASVSYNLLKLDGTRLGSKRTGVRVVGTPGLLRAPWVLDAQGDLLAPDLPYARVLIPIIPNVRAGDDLTLRWLGTPLSGVPLEYIDSRPVSYEQVGQPIERIVPADYILPLKLGRVAVSYTVGTGESLRPSAVLPLRVGNPDGALPMPDVVQAPDGFLDPDDLPAAGATLSIPISNVMALEDTIIYNWVGSATSDTTDSTRLTSLARPLLFDIDRVYIDPNVDGTVSARYRVEREGVIVGLSATRVLAVGKRLLDLLPPSVMEAPNAVLDPMHVVNGATLTVAYEQMDERHTLGIRWADDDGFAQQPGSNAGRVDFAISPQVVGRSIGRTFEVRYAVVRALAPEQVSPPLVLTVLAPASDQLPTPQITEAQGTVLDVNALTGDATWRVAPWPFIATGQSMWCWLEGTQIGDQPLRITLLSGQTVTTGEASGGVTRSVSRIQLRQLNDLSRLTCVFKVNFDDQHLGLEDEAVTFPTAQWTIRALPDLQLLAPEVDEASPDGVVDPDAVPAQGATVRVKPYTGMAIGDRVQALWSGPSQSYPCAPQYVEATEALTFTVPVQVVVNNAGQWSLALYTVLRASGQGPVYSPNLALTILSKLRLLVPWALDADNGLLDPDRVGDQGTRIQVRAYEGMRSGDRVWVVWQGEGPAYETQPQPVNAIAHLDFLVPKAQVLANQQRGVEVFYRVLREGAVDARDSARLPLRVLALLVLPAPNCREARGTTLDPDDLGLSGATIEVPHYTGMSSNDAVNIRWRGAGQDYQSAVQKVGTPGPLQFHVPRSVVLANATMNITLVYQVLRASGGELRDSDVLNLRVLEQLILEAPRSLDTTSDHLDPDDIEDSGARLQVPHYAGMAVGDSIRVHWQSAQLPYDTPAAPVQAIGAQLFRVPKDIVLAHAGITQPVRVIYSVVRAGGSPARESAVLLLWVLRGLELKAPESVDAVNAVLDPDRIAATGSKMIVKAYTGMTTGDEVTLSFAGPVQGQTPPSQFVETLTDLEYLITKATIAANAGEYVAVHYQVIRAEGGPPKDSESLPLIVLGSLSLRPPTAPLAPGGALDPDAVEQDGVVIRVPAYGGMLPGDRVQVFWIGPRLDHTSEVRTADAIAPMDFQVPLYVVQQNIGLRVTVHYKVTRVSGQGPFDSGLLVLTILLPMVLTPPDALDSRGGELDPYSVMPEGARVQVPAYTGMNIGDIINVFWSGPGADHETLPQDVSAIGTLLFHVPLAVVMANLERRIALYYNVIRVGGSLSRNSPQRSLTLLGLLELPHPDALDAVDGVLDPEIVAPEGARVRVPAYTGMALRDSVAVVWDVTGEPHTTPAQTVTELGTLELRVPKEVVRARGGRTVTIIYQVSRPASLIPKASEPLLLPVLLALDLTPPDCLDLVNDYLDPINVGPNGIRMQVPAYTGMQVGDQVRLLWVSPGGNVTTPYVDVVSIGALPFLLDRALMDANKGQVAVVTYQVIRPSGAGPVPSRELRVPVVANLVLTAPDAPEWPTRVVVPESVPANGLLIQVPAYAGMMPKDTLRVLWNGGGGNHDSGPLIVPSIAPQDHRVPLTVVRANAELDVTILYQVTRATGGDVHTSPTLGLHINRLRPPLVISPATMVLSGIIRGGFTPSYPPAGSTQTRAATGGTPPYRYTSSNAQVAEVNVNTGRVIAAGNGGATITVRDNEGESASYGVSVSGVQIIAPIAHTTYLGAVRDASARGGRVPSLNEWDRFRGVYTPGQLHDNPNWSSDSAGGIYQWAITPSTGSRTRLVGNFLGGGQTAGGWYIR